MGMKKLLVLGGTGRIGTMLRHSWDRMPLAAPTEFVFQTRGQGGMVWDMLSDLPDTVKAAGPYDAMLVLAGVVPGPDARLPLNSDLGLAALEAAAVMGVERVLLASSSAVYGAQKDSPYAEGDHPQPANEYGQAKLTMEQVCRAKAGVLGLELCCLRIGNVAGADALLLNAGALRDGQALTLDRFPDGGTPLRSYIGPQTLAEVLGALIHSDSRLPDLLNIAAPAPVEMGALAQAAKATVTFNRIDHAPHQYITLDCAQLAERYRFDPADSTAPEMVRQWRALRV